jgi:membrane protein DedA with SNARE-associated domain
MTLQQFIETYGYAAVFAGCFLEGETTLVLGAVAAHLGMLRIGIVIAVATVASFLGDCLWFFLGHRYGRQLLARWPRLAAKAVSARERIDRQGAWIIVVMRFLIGMRIAIIVALGAAGMPAVRFLPLDALGALIWSTAFGVAGFAFGAAVTAAVERAKSDVEIALGLAVLVTAAHFAIAYWRRRRRATIAHEPD